MAIIGSTLEEVLKRYGDGLRKGITDRYDNSGVKASGNAVKSLKDVIEGNNYTLMGADYWQWIDRGRKPNGANTGGLFDALYEWLKYKKYNLNWKNDKERKGIAFALSRKISELGTYKNIHKDKRTTILEDSLKDSLKSLTTDIEKTLYKRIELNYKTILDNAND